MSNKNENTRFLARPAYSMMSSLCILTAFNAWQTILYVAESGVRGGIANDQEEASIACLACRRKTSPWYNKTERVGWQLWLWSIAKPACSATHWWALERWWWWAEKGKKWCGHRCCNWGRWLARYGGSGRTRWQRWGVRWSWRLGARGGWGRGQGGQWVHSSCGSGSSCAWCRGGFAQRVGDREGEK